jgi:3-oxoadipate enol-lactonase
VSVRARDTTSDRRRTMETNSAEHDGICSSPNGGRLNYSVAGRGDPVVFLHGFGLDKAMWNAQWPLFSRSFRTIRYDLRGFGASSVPAEPYSHVSDFVALTNLLEAQPAHLVGLSNGGRIALRIALEEPAAVKTLTLVDTALDGYRWSEAHAQSWRMIAMTGRTDVAKAKQQWLEHPLFAPARTQPELADDLAVMVARYSGWHFHNTDLEAKAQKDVIHNLAAIAAPTLVIVGERDQPDFQAIARIVAGEIPDASLRVIPGVGHMSNLEDADPFNRLVLAHLNRDANRMAV